MTTLASACALLLMAGPAPLAAANPAGYADLEVINVDVDQWQARLAADNSASANLHRGTELAVLQARLNAIPVKN